MNRPTQRARILQTFTGIALIALSGTHSSPARAAAPTAWDQALFDHVEGSSAVFKATGSDPAPVLKTPLQELAYIGKLRPISAGGLPWFLFRGKLPGQELAIHALRPNDTRPSSFVHPGRVLEPKTRAVTLDSRAFYGKCVTGREDVYVVFQKERIEKKRKRGGRQVKTETSVFLAEAASDHLNEKLFERGQPRLDHTLKHVRAKECFEIEGRNRVMASRTPISGPWNDSQDDDDDDDDDGDSSGAGAAGASNAKPADGKPEANSSAPAAVIAN